MVGEHGHGTGGHRAGQGRSDHVEEGLALEGLGHVAVCADLAATSLVVRRLCRGQNEHGNIRHAAAGFQFAAQVVATAVAKRDVSQNEIRTAVPFGHYESLVDGLGEAQGVPRPLHDHGNCLLNRETVVSDQDAFAHW